MAAAPAVAGLYRRTLARRIRLVCVVGSYGKTTTAAAVATVLGTSPPPSDNAFSSLALWLLRQPSWQRYAVFEAGIDGPEQMAAYGTMLRPDLVVVTSIGTAILNADDPRVAAMAARCAGRVIRFGIDAKARTTDVAIDWPYGTRVTLRIGRTVRLVRLRLVGRVMVYPFLAAMSVAQAEGLPLDRAIAALEALPPRRGRLQLEPLPGAAWLVRDDFKSSVETIDAALDVLSGIPGRRIVVIGSVSEPPGSQGPIYRRIGTRLAELASRVVVVSSEFQRYAADVRAGGLSRSALVDVRRDVKGAWEVVRADLRPGDVVLVKGRDTERLDRIGLALQGHDVRCTIDFCDLRGVRCEACPKLETGWVV